MGRIGSALQMLYDDSERWNHIQPAVKVVRPSEPLAEQPPSTATSGEGLPTTEELFTTSEDAISDPDVDAVSRMDELQTAYVQLEELSVIQQVLDLSHGIPSVDIDEDSESESEEDGLVADAEPATEQVAVTNDATDGESRLEVSVNPETSTDDADHGPVDGDWDQTDTQSEAVNDGVEVALTTEELSPATGELSPVTDELLSDSDFDVDVSTTEVPSDARVASDIDSSKPDFSGSTLDSQDATPSSNHSERLSSLSLPKAAPNPQDLVDVDTTEAAVAEDELAEDELAEDELVEDELVEDELVEDEATSPLGSESPDDEEGILELGLETISDLSEESDCATEQSIVTEQSVEAVVDTNADEEKVLDLVCGVLGIDREATAEVAAFEVSDAEDASEISESEASQFDEASESYKASESYEASESDKVSGFDELSRDADNVVGEEPTASDSGIDFNVGGESESGQSSLADGLTEQAESDQIASPQQDVALSANATPAVSNEELEESHEAEPLPDGEGDDQSIDQVVLEDVEATRSGEELGDEDSMPEVVEFGDAVNDAEPLTNDGTDWRVRELGVRVDDDHHPLDLTAQEEVQSELNLLEEVLGISAASIVESEFANAFEQGGNRETIVESETPHAANSEDSPDFALASAEVDTPLDQAESTGEVSVPPHDELPVGPHDVQISSDGLTTEGISPEDTSADQILPADASPAANTPEEASDTSLDGTASHFEPVMETWAQLPSDDRTGVSELRGEAQPPFSNAPFADDGNNRKSSTGLEPLVSEPSDHSGDFAVIPGMPPMSTPSPALPDLPVGAATETNFASDESLAEESLADESLADESLADESVADEPLPEESFVEEAFVQEMADVEHDGPTAEVDPSSLVDEESPHWDSGEGDQTEAVELPDIASTNGVSDEVVEDSEDSEESEDEHSKSSDFVLTPQASLGEATGATQAWSPAHGILARLDTKTAPLPFERTMAERLLESEFGTHIQALSDQILKDVPEIPSSVLFVSSEDDPQRADIVAGLAMYICGRSDSETLLVDADVPHRRVSRNLEQPGLGLAENLYRDSTWYERVVATSCENLRFLPSGRTFEEDERDSVLPAATRHLFTEWRNSFGLTILDGGTISNPLLPHLVELTDAVYLCVRLGEDAREEVAAVTTQIAQWNGRLRGCVTTGPSSV